MLQQRSSISITDHKLGQEYAATEIRKDIQAEIDYLQELQESHTRAPLSDIDGILTGLSMALAKVNRFGEGGA